ncbi:pyruvate, water dikinase regulatory protein [Lapidilactobacillus gannanensis]|jgi:regulator of PEP synthase PpsR (kinase-PPPase family)|uniref:Putative pyruvate, phosphate dikinase regulatory protein n=1 Tax=Lapidilactobacillus gannanensis TaxID=2486002 RepID=A0ABW4BQ98_9LACO|nr:pyruvate, water dikinase regulatory protein [Lapidilactobacillus gannanensis]MCH4057489.1 kinase/pyrophosphorylase [Lactobacillaceae bacterium]
MAKPKTLYVCLISDSVGETAFKLAQAVMVQFPDIKPMYERFPFVTNKQKVDDLIKTAVERQAIVAHTVVTKDLSDYIQAQAAANGLVAIDLISPMITAISQRFDLTPTHEAGAVHHLTEHYFDRISAMEFAVLYDDGKDPRGFLEADVVLLGISRTSKTPLSLFLANRNIKVANLPIVPQAHIPDEIYQVDPHKIIGLTNDPKVLNNIRRERMIAYGLNPDTTYSDLDAIKKELSFAQDLYQKLGCYVINVANRSIEETATLILEKLGLDSY